MGDDGGLPRGFELQEIEETENALWIREQLNRIRVFLSEPFISRRRCWADWPTPCLQYRRTAVGHQGWFPCR
jgi:hypothetical protein